MNLLERYRNGESQLIFSEIRRLGNAAFSDEHFDAIKDVMEETFNRVAYNIEVIYSELKSLGYIFWKDTTGKDDAFCCAVADVEINLEYLSESVSSIGYLPLSLTYFYRIVGSCNLAWNYQEEPAILWEMSDPLQIAPLPQVLEEVKNPDWLEIAEETIEEGDLPVLELAADSLHKDNISGGPPYGIELQNYPCIDSKFIDGISNTSFIQYLRTCFEYAGFPGFAQRVPPESFLKFQQKIKPLLLSI